MTAMSPRMRQALPSRGQDVAIGDMLACAPLHRRGNGVLRTRFGQGSAFRGTLPITRSADLAAAGPTTR